MSAFQTKIFYLLLTVLLSLILLVPTLHYIPVLSTGDHGRDFYCAQQILEGKIPYHDFWWVYGPLMPYYYALFYKMLGITMSSILVGKVVLILICEVFFYLTLSLFAPALFALIGTLWFLLYMNDFFFTYNHIGGVACLLGSLYYVFSYLNNDKSKYLSLSIFCLFILGLIKINFALSSLFAFIISVRAIEYFQQYPRKNLSLLIALLLGSLAGIYFLLLHSLPMYEIRQCFPYLSSDQPNQSTPVDSIREAMTQVVLDGTASLSNTAFTLLILMSGLFIIITCLSKKTPANAKNFIFAGVITLGAFYILNIHEYILSGTTYRAYWVKPVSILLVFTLIYLATKHLKPIIHFLLYSTLLLNIGLEVTNRYTTMQQIKRPESFLSIPRAQVYVGNEPAWIDTVQQTTNFLKTHLKSSETFFALPYDCLYYFLTEKDSPTRQLIFFDHINIPPEQEIKIIRELEKTKVNWMVISSRSISLETGLGKWGVSYCPLIGKYIAENYEVVAEFGPWTSLPGWAWNHGTRIMKRTGSL